MVIYKKIWWSITFINSTGIYNNYKIYGDYKYGGSTNYMMIIKKTYPFID